MRDLIYRGKLLGAIIIEDKGAKWSADEEGKAKEEADTNEFKPEDAMAAQLRMSESWFPPMCRVLQILSKIFHVVEPRVFFEDIPLQLVQSCTKSLKDRSVHCSDPCCFIFGEAFAGELSHVLYILFIVMQSFLLPIILLHPVPL